MLRLSLWAPSETSPPEKLLPMLVLVLVSYSLGRDLRPLSAFDGTYGRFTKPSSSLKLYELMINLARDH